MIFALKNLKDPHTPILPVTPHFFWDEVLQNNGTIKAFEGRDFNIIEDPGVMRNIIQHALMMEEFRKRVGDIPIKINSWYRPEVYNSVVLRENGYKSSYVSDHLCTNSCATDVELRSTSQRKAHWINICAEWNVNYNIGTYETFMHLGWRTDRDSILIDRR